MNRAAFYAAMRPVIGPLNQSQVDGFESLLDHAEVAETPLHHLAYILATTWHETAFRMQPIAEFGKGRGRAYGKPAGPYGHKYYGRGYVQLTWLSNYERASDELGPDFVRFPDLVMKPGHAAMILFHGMAEGWFTGKKLSDFINANRVDYRGARKIINGTDRAEKIAGYARSYEHALRAAGYLNPTEKLTCSPA